MTKLIKTGMFILLTAASITACQDRDGSIATESAAIEAIPEQAAIRAGISPHAGPVLASAETVPELAALEMAIEKSRGTTDADWGITFEETYQFGERTIQNKKLRNIKWTGIGTDSPLLIHSWTGNESDALYDVLKFYNDDVLYVRQKTADGEKKEKLHTLSAMAETIKKEWDEEHAELLQQCNLNKLTVRKMNVNTDSGRVDQGSETGSAMLYSCPLSDETVAEFVDSEFDTSFYRDENGKVNEGIWTDQRMDFQESYCEWIVDENGYLSGFRMSVTVNMTLDGKTAGITVKRNDIMHNPGEPVTAAVPDLSGYESVNEISYDLYR